MEADKPRQLLELLAKEGEMKSTLSGFWKLVAEKGGAERQVRKRLEAAFTISTFHCDSGAAFWVLWNLSLSEALKHCLMFGASDARKAVAIRLFPQTTTSRFAPSSTETKRSSAFDVECNILRPLGNVRLCPEETHSCILNSFNKAAGAWNIADAVQTPRMAFALASFLVPGEKQSTCPYFLDAARELVYAVILALNQVAGTHWTLDDLFRALDSGESIARITSVLPDVSRVRNGFLEDKQHLPSILATLSVKLRPFETAADLHGTACVSLWLLGGILEPARVN